MSRPSYIQMEKLVQFLEENPGIAKGHLRSAQARHQTKLKWEEITILLNSLGGATKDSKSWAKFWADKKYALKKQVAQRNASASRTGGGVDRLQPITELEERLIFVMGGSSFAEGDQELSVPLIIPLESENPLPQHPDESETRVHDEPIPSTSQAVQSPVSRTSAPSTPRRNPRIRPRRLQQSQLHTERQRLIRIEEKRVEAEVANAAGWGSLVQSIDHLANAILVCGDKIAQALCNRH